VSLYEKFPEFRTKKLVLAGESYSGHTIPLLATRVQTYNKEQLAKGADGAPRIPLHRFMVGNPSFSDTDGSRYYDFMREHALLDAAVYDRAVVACNGSLDGGPGHHGDGGDSPQCTSLKLEMRAQLVGINPYNVLARCESAPSPSGGCFTMQEAA